MIFAGHTLKNAAFVARVLSVHQLGGMHPDVYFRCRVVHSRAVRILAAEGVLLSSRERAKLMSIVEGALGVSR